MIRIHSTLYLIHYISYIYTISHTIRLTLYTYYIYTGFKIVIFPFIKPLLASTLSTTNANYKSSHATDMESFYQYQKEGIEYSI